MNAILYSLTIFLLFFEKILLLCCLFQMNIKSYRKFVDMPQNGKTYNHINKTTTIKQIPLQKMAFLIIIWLLTN